MKRLSVATEFGPLTLTEDQNCLTVIAEGDVADPEPTPLLREAARQLQAYLHGGLRQFSVPLKPSGTPFQQRIWALMSQIPFGETCSYGDIALQAGSAPRAVGMACGANPIIIMIPCHRVIGKAGLTGYSGPGGVATKRFLLGLEQQQEAVARRPA